MCFGVVFTLQERSDLCLFVLVLTVVSVCHCVQFRNEGRGQDDRIHHVLKLHLDT